MDTARIDSRKDERSVTNDGNAQDVDREVPARRRWPLGVETELAHPGA